MKYPRITALTASLLLITGCAPHYMKKPHGELAYPGFLDVGAGYAVIPHATQTSKDASGFTATIKAYPGGRWYAPVLPASEADKAEAVAQKAAKILQDEKVKAAKEVLEKSQKDLNAAKAKPVAVDETEKQKDLKALEALEAENKKAQENHKKAISDAVGTIPELSTDAKLYQIREAGLLRKIFVFYGRSIGGYGDAVNGEVDSIGLGYDITPEFGLIAGHARFRTEPAPGTTDTDEGLLFGVQINLSAFQMFRALKAE